ncbi:transcription termination factor MTERF2, chloroplastic-like [Abrus precatorius]|uniref:Transcription termination factor MTERF2, chloroplastic-like n=1 Tax=Abrus precatorius TaxID=3816 RepID=A0A8B8KMQ0_ABRPR|nr:transcription termination factor MTERF2, chloroplastic-like [Abrus precatorius]XP_027344050.1 transcription termination factor MTERF2, chloroplastic-like [Abrus precatorius]
MVPIVMITRLTATASSFTHYNNKGTLIPLGSLLQHKHNAFLSFLNSFASSTSSDSESDKNYHKGDTFTVSYLVNSCGVSPELAKKLSKNVHLKNQDGPNAVLDLLKTYGFSETHVANLVAKNPKVLTAKADNTFLPKLKFFRSIGVSNTDMPKIIIRNYIILWRSLEKRLIPRYESLRSVVCSDEEVVRVLRRGQFTFGYSDMRNDLVRNIEVLRQCGVPQPSISLLVIHYPFAPNAKHSEFVEAVKIVEEIGFDPLKTTFVQAVQVLLGLTKAKWESKFEVYERWGWDRKMALRAFRKFPNFMKLSETVIAKKMNFLVNDMSLASEDIADYPPILAYSLNKRIIPRFSVVKILTSKGLLKNNLHFSSFLWLSEEKFLKKFVNNFQKDLPHLKDDYTDLINCENVI